MTAQESIDLFYNEMLNDIMNAPADDALRQYLIDSLKDVRKTVIDTLNSSK